MPDACHSRSNKRFALTQQSRRKLLARKGLLPSRLRRDKLPAASTCFHQPQALCGIQSLAVFVTAFVLNWCYSMPFRHRCQPPVSFFSCTCPGLCFSCFQHGMIMQTLDKPRAACYLLFTCDDDATLSSPLPESRRSVRVGSRKERRSPIRAEGPKISVGLSGTPRYGDLSGCGTCPQQSGWYRGLCCYKSPLQSMMAAGAFIIL